MKEKIKRIIECRVVKVDEDNGIVSAIATTDSIDRYRERVIPTAFKKRLKTYKAHPVLLANHDYSDIEKQIGAAIPSTIEIDEKKMKVDFKYFVGEGNKSADWGFFLAKQGMAAYSIGFIAHKWEDKDVSKDGYYRDLTDGELIEISHVTVPANQDALQNMYQNGYIDDDEYKNLAECLRKFLDEVEEFGLKYFDENGEKVEKKSPAINCSEEDETEKRIKALEDRLEKIEKGLNPYKNIMKETANSEGAKELLNEFVKIKEVLSNKEEIKLWR